MAAFKTALLLLSSVWFLVSCAADEQNCSEVNCEVLPVGENLASEFKLKASEKGVRMIYLNLEIGNDSYNPLELQDEIFPDRWVWARSNSEPMLSLPYDYDILSLGLLNYQVRSMTVPLRDEPSGCLAGLNSTCQNMAVGKALLDNVTRDRLGEISQKAGVVCVAMIEKDGQTDESPIKYHCCSANAPMVMVNCGLPVEGSNWFSAFNTFLGCLSFVVLQYFPAVLLILPDCIFNLQEECDKEDCTEDQLTNNDQAESIAINHTRNGYEQIQNEEEGRLTKREIPVDDASPVTCSTLLLGYVQQLPDLRLSFNVKLAVLLFCITPFVLYVQLGFYLTLKQKYIHECFVKLPQNALPFYLSISSSLTIFVLSVFGFTCFMFALCLRPKDLFLQKETAVMVCPTCILAQTMSITLFITENSTDSINICDKIHQHLKLLQEVVYFLMSFFLKLHNSGLELLTIKFNTCSLLKKINRDGLRVVRALLILWRLISTLSTLFCGLVLGAICLLLLVFALSFLALIHFSPFVALFIFFLCKTAEMMKTKFRNRQSVCRLVYVFSFMYLVLLEIATLNIVLTICNFILGMLGFTIMGLVLNVEIVTPYVALFLVVTTNMYFCFANVQSRYKEVKGFILKYWQQELQTNRNRSQNAIPAKLFWFVCDRAFPVKTEICLMFRNMSVILTFLYLAITSIIFFGNTYDISTLVSTIAVFISGVIPSLFFKGLTRGNNFTGCGKIELEREIETAVKEYLRQSGHESEEERSLDNNSVVV